MKSFRNPKYLDRYEDVVYDLEQTLDAAPANAAHQTKTGLRFVADNTGESTHKIVQMLSKGEAPKTPLLKKLLLIKMSGRCLNKR